MEDSRNFTAEFKVLKKSVKYDIFDLWLLIENFNLKI